MILGIGTDIVELERVKSAIAKTGFKEKVFTAGEIGYCSKAKNEERFAARFAAKEAFFKALGTGWADNMEFSEVEILNDDKGKPEIVLSGKAQEVFKAMGGERIHVSLSHIKEMAVAFVVIEGRGKT